MHINSKLPFCTAQTEGISENVFLDKNIFVKILLDIKSTGFTVRGQALKQVGQQNKVVSLMSNMQCMLHFIGK